MKNKLSIIVSLAVVVGLIGLLFYFFRERPDSRPTSQQTQPLVTKQKAPGEVSPLGNAGNDPRPTYESVHWADLSGVRMRLLAGIATGDRKQWDPILSELMNFMEYRREDAIVLLREVLQSTSDWNVKVMTAVKLVELGSEDGVGILNSALREAGRDGTVSEIMVLHAAATLHRYGFQIDRNILWQATQRYPSQDMLSIAALQGVPEIADVVRQKRAANASVFATESLAVYLRMTDADSINRYKEMLTFKDESTRLLGYWALYQATHEKLYLAELITAAQKCAGIGLAKGEIPKKNEFVSLPALMVTVGPESTRALEQIVEHIANDPHGDSGNFAQAFEALFYLHKDYAFIDQQLAEFFNSREAQPGPGVSRDAIWRIAAVRRTPAIENRAHALNAEAYIQNFVRVQGRPIEGWLPTRLISSRQIDAARQN